jgi:FkbM family methyltransferase
MIGKKLKDIIQGIAHKYGYHVQSKNGISGDMELFLKGIKVRGFNPNGIINVGANKGDWSEMASTIYPQSSFFLIEPQEEHAKDLDNFFKNHEGKWYLGGAGAENGELKLSVWDDLAGSSFLSGEGGKNQRTVPVFSLNSLVTDRGMPIPDLCKIDVQGFEIEVLKGASSLIGKTEVFILESSLFEFNKNQPLLIDIINYMSQRNYAIYDFAGFLNRPYDMALGQLDICFVLENSLLRQNKSWA